MLIPKNNLLILTNTHGIGCTNRTIEVFTRKLNRKLFNIHLIYLDQAYDNPIEHSNGFKEINIVLTNSIFFGEGKSYQKAIALLNYCQQQQIRVVDIAHFAKFDPLVDSLLTKRLFVSQTLLLKYALLAQKHGLSLGKYDYLYNPVSIITRTLSDTKLAEQAAVAAKGTSQFVIGRIGRANIDKWDHMIIKIVPYILAKIPQCKFIIQSMPKELISKIPTNLKHHVQVLPETNNHQQVLETIQRCDILVQTSKIGESFGCAIAEGMALGKPIITNSTDFHAPVFFDRDNAQIELIEDTVNGFVENTPEKMAQRIVELYENRALYEKISQANKKKVATLFGVEKLTQRLENFLLGKEKKLAILPLTLADYKAKIKKESFMTIISLNMEYFMRRLRRKLTHLGLLRCC